ncbi:MAG: hypothetical protein L6R35_006162, partial [Caloplaca aegaea]
MEVAQQLCVSVIPSLNDNRGTEIVIIVAVMTAVSTIAVILRLIGRKLSAAPYGTDDFLILVALILTYGLDVNEIVAVHYGFGKHQLMLSLDHIEKFLLNDWTIQIIFACAISTTRLSLLVFYHRLFPVRRFTIVAIITGCILIGWWIAFIFAIVFSCYPIASFWNKTIVGRCVNEHTLSWGVTGSELATNIIMLVLPIPWLWDLRLAWTKKLALIGIFALGCFICISCIVRFPLLASLKQTDASWTIVPAGIWIVVECNIGIASVCVPLMWPLISLDFSSLSAYLSFSRSWRTGSPFADEETKTETSSGVPSSGKPCEKPYDGPCGNAHGNPHPILNHVSRPLAQQHGTRHHKNHTHRSRIESYTTDTSASDSPKPPPPPKVKEARSSAPLGVRNTTTSPLAPLQSKPTGSSAPSAPRAAPSHNPGRDAIIFNLLQAQPASKATEARSSAPPGPINTTTSPIPPPEPQPPIRSSAPPAPRGAASSHHQPRRNALIFNPLQAHPPSIRNLRRHHQKPQPDPLKAPRGTPPIRKPQALPPSSRHRSAPPVSNSPQQKKPPRHRSAPMPVPVSA